MSADDFFDRLRKNRPHPTEPSDRASGRAPQAAPSGAERRPDHDPEAGDRRARRERRLAEQLLVNESLTDGLDDQAANRLLDWGLSLAAQAAAHLDHLPSDETAAPALDQAAQAAQELLRRARRLALEPAVDPLQRQDGLLEIFRLARLARGEPPPTRYRARAAELQALDHLSIDPPPAAPAASIDALRAAVESAARRAPA
ncbi:MAG: hypothetical protein ACKOC5_01670, partial [Chloroflexota bacterium]